MVGIRKMRMHMRERIVLVPVGMAHIRRNRNVVGVLVMSVVHVLVFMLQRFVEVLMRMSFGEMQPHPERHQPAGNQQAQRDRFTQQGQRDQSTDERCHRKIGAGARGAKVA